MNLKTFFGIKEIDKFTIVNIYLKLLFALGGISENSRTEMAVSSSITVIAALEVLGCVVGYVNTKGIDILFSEGVAYSLFLSYHWVIKNHKKCVRRLAALIRNPISANDLEINTKVTEYFARAIGVVGIFNVLFLFFICVPMTIPLYARFSFHDSLGYIMPYWYFCDQNGRNNFPVRFLCVHVDNYSKYLAINVVAYISVVFGVFIFESTTLFYMFTYTYLRAHHDVVVQHISRVTETSDEFFVQVHSMRLSKRSHQEKDFSDLRRKYDQLIRDQVVDLIRHQQFIFSIILDVVPVYRAIISSTLLAIYTVGVFCILYLLRMTQDDAGQMIFQIKMGTVLIMLLVVFLLLCYGADSMNFMNNRISSAMYETPWYCNSLEYRKMMLIFLMQMQKPVSVTAFGMYRITLSYYAIMVKNIYSVLNVVLMKLGAQ